MERSELNRRDFHKFSLAALGGMVAGTQIVHGQNKDKDKDKNPLLVEPHVCRGLNTCKEKGAGKKNACAGQGTCATAKAHECKGMGQCKGQGGCGAKPGENECKGKGECAVPLSDKAWDKTRKRFEEVAKKEGIKLGAAPPKPKKK